MTGIIIPISRPRVMRKKLGQCEGNSVELRMNLATVRETLTILLENCTFRKKIPRRFQVNDEPFQRDSSTQFIVYKRFLLPLFYFYLQFSFSSSFSYHFKLNVIDTVVISFSFNILNDREY